MEDHRNTDGDISQAEAIDEIKKELLTFMTLMCDSLDTIEKRLQTVEKRQKGIARIPKTYEKDIEIIKYIREHGFMSFSDVHEHLNFSNHSSAYRYSREFVKRHWEDYRVSKMYGVRFPPRNIIVPIPFVLKDENPYEMIHGAIEDMLSAKIVPSVANLRAVGYVTDDEDLEIVISEYFTTFNREKE